MTWRTERWKSLLQNRKQKKRMKRNEDCLRDFWDIKHTNIRIIGVPEREEREKRPEKISEEIWLTISLEWERK